MYCGNCYTMCPSMPLADTEGDGIVLMAGGKVSNRISDPKFLQSCSGISYPMRCQDGHP